MDRIKYVLGGEVSMDYDFGADAQDFYSPERGYGFLPLERCGQKVDRFTGTGGWYAKEGCLKEQTKAADRVCEIVNTEEGVAANRRGYPLRFRAKVPGKGTYGVTVTLRGGRLGCKRFDLVTNRRNLVRRGLSIAPGETKEITFYVHICEYIPVIGEPPKLDDSIYVTLLTSHQGAAETSRQEVAEASPQGAEEDCCQEATESPNQEAEETFRRETTEACCQEASEEVSLCSVVIERKDVPTVFLAGDSLVTDYDGQYPDNPLMNYGSWGQDLLSFLPGAAVNNQAHAGMTTNCFRDDGHFDIVMRNFRPGDVFVMQFGHNDQKRRNLKAYGGYAANLRWYIRRIREKGGYPVIVTPLSRIPSRDEDGYFDLLEEHAQSCLRVGKELHVPVIDLHSYSFDLMCRAGVEVSRDYFCDVTHTNDYGAMVAAYFIAGEIRRQRIMPLWKLMEAKGAKIEETKDSKETKELREVKDAKETKELREAKDAKETKELKEAKAAKEAKDSKEIKELKEAKELESLPAWLPDVSLRPPHTVSSAQKEEKPVLPHDLPALPYADCQHIRQEQELKEAMWLGLLDPCIRFYHPFEVMPRGQFLYLFFKAVPTPKKRGYQGKYCDIYRYEWDASAVQAAEDSGLIDSVTTPFDRFRPDDALTGGELVSFMVRSLHGSMKREIPMWECERQARALGLLWEAYGKEEPVNRLDCTVALVRLMKLRKSGDLILD